MKTRQPTQKEFVRLKRMIEVEYADTPWPKARHEVLRMYKRGPVTATLLEMMGYVVPDDIDRQHERDEIERLKQRLQFHRNAVKSLSKKLRSIESEKTDACQTHDAVSLVST